tara:strand:+ start:152 stop:508 length:357 start_codon:yes stop_codon:yes gene_type:complete
MNPHDATVTNTLVALQRSEDRDKPALLLRLAEKLNAAGSVNLALRTLEQANRLAPDDPKVLWALGLALCRTGNPREGLTLYDRGRWKLPAFREIWRNLPQPLWQGENVTGKRLILSAE